jgi:hypothetical protein
MNISSYNVTDVSYHYIGLRILARLATTARRKEQINTISHSVSKYVNDKALHLMLPEPQGTFKTVGEKICQELVHFKFARSIKGTYKLTDAGINALKLLNEHRYVELRKLMVQVHLQTYDNLRAVLQRYLEVGYICLPVVEAKQLAAENYVQCLLEPTFNEESSAIAVDTLNNLQVKSPRKIKDALWKRVLRRIFPDMRVSVSLFHALVDRLVSLRLLNVMKTRINGCDFAKSYSPCVRQLPPQSWYVPLEIYLSSGEPFCFHFCEPDMADKKTQGQFLEAIDEAFSKLSPQAGYYDLPEVRYFVCDQLKIPDAAFDEGINHFLDLQLPFLTFGLRYEDISSRRKPIKSHNQIYNLIRRTNYALA